MTKSIDIHIGDKCNSCLGCNWYLPKLKENPEGLQVGMCGSRFSMYKLTYTPELHSCTFYQDAVSTNTKVLVSAKAG